MTAWLMFFMHHVAEKANAAVTVSRDYVINQLDAEKYVKFAFYQLSPSG
jgi:hypothetical protein